MSTPAAINAPSLHAGPPPSRGYRPDIDGLRAVAVLAVVVFHAFPYSLPGGYIGVDVFFVISGFLISGILFDALEKGNFSILDFYSRRVRRIFPALILVLVFTWACGWFILVAANYRNLGKEIAGGASFIANIVAWNEAGYFANASETKPLLHLWSLGIEEQFYAVWPLILYLAWRWRYSWLRVTGLIIALSLALELYTMRGDAIASFYSPFTRFWELLVGGALACLVRQPDSAMTKAGNARSLAGLALIGAGALAMDTDSDFPGWLAMVPTAGAFLILSAGPQAWANRTLLAHPVARWFGLISYPLYLWHWPLLTFARILEFGTPSRFVRIGALVAGVLFSWLTYLFIEGPIRSRGGTRLKVAGLCAGLAVVFLAGVLTWQSGGLAGRQVNRDARALMVQHYEQMLRSGLRESYHLECNFHDWRTDRAKDAISDDCVQPGVNGTWLLWGDSHAQALSSGLRSILPEGVRLAQITTSSCKPALRPRADLSPGDPCNHSNAFALEQVARLKPDVVLLDQMNHHLRTDWEAFADALHAAGARRVVLVGPVPQWLPSLPLVVAKYYWGLGHETVATGLDQPILDTDRRLAERYGHSPKLAYLSLIRSLCHANGCLATVPGVEGYNLMAVDYGHLSPDASVYVAREILAPALIGDRGCGPYRPCK